MRNNENQPLSLTLPFGENGFSVGRCAASASKPVRCRKAGNFPTPRIIQDRVRERGWNIKAFLLTLEIVNNILDLGMKF